MEEMDMAPTSDIIPFTYKVGSLLNSIIAPSQDAARERNRGLNKLMADFIENNFDTVINNFLEFLFRRSEIVSSSFMDALFNRKQRLILCCTDGVGFTDKESDARNESVWEDAADDYSRTGWWAYNLASLKRPKIPMELRFLGITETVMDMVYSSMIPRVETLLHCPTASLLKDTRFMRLLGDYCKEEHLRYFYRSRGEVNRPILDLGISWGEAMADEEPSLSDFWRLTLEGTPEAWVGRMEDELKKQEEL